MDAELLFKWPWALALLPLPWLARLLLPAAAQVAVALRVPFLGVLRQLPRPLGPLGDARRSALWLLWALWILVVLGAARPTWLGAAQNLPASGRDLLLAVDISGSMKQRDMTLDGQAVTRLEAVKNVVGEFIARRAGDRLGLLLFGTRPYLQTPLTFDHATMATLLDEARIGFAGERTAVGDSIGLGVKHLLKRPEQHRVMVLLTDGSDTASEIKPLRAAELAADQGIKIYTIGIGADSMTVPGLLFSRRLNPSADLDEKTLRAVAELTGGMYFRARDPEQLVRIYATLDELEPLELDSELFRPSRDLYHWPLGLALILSFGMGAWRAQGTGAA